MRFQLIDLETQILENRTYLFENFSNSKKLLSQIGMILDFGLNNEIIVEWFRLNRISVNIINELVKKKLQKESNE